MQLGYAKIVFVLQQIELNLFDRGRVVQYNHRHYNLMKLKKNDLVQGVQPFIYK